MLNRRCRARPAQRPIANVFRSVQDLIASFVQTQETPMLTRLLLIASLLAASALTSFGDAQAAAQTGKTAVKSSTPVASAQLGARIHVDPLPSAAVPKTTPAPAPVTLSAFVAEYDLYRNGKQLGSSEIKLSKSRKGYVFETTSRSEGGMASLVGGAEIQESSEFALRGSDFVSLSYNYKQSVSFKKKRREISFDWAKNQARESDGENTTHYLLSPGTLDRHLVVLALAQDLKANRALDHTIAYKGEATSWAFANKGEEMLSTSLGSIKAIKLERVRANKGRSTVSWHAPLYKHLPVQIRQTEPDGEVIEMRLRKFDFTGG
jgi:guanyl-specific ribonuclease Sa